MSASEPRRMPGTARVPRHQLPSSLTEDQRDKLALLLVHLVLADLRNESAGVKLPAGSALSAETPRALA